MKTVSISLITFCSLFLSSAFACIQFPTSYRCSSTSPNQEYDITLILNSSETIPTYTVKKSFADRSESYSLKADGTEVQFEGSLNHVLYRSATCTIDTLTLNMREKTSTNNFQIRSTSTFQLMASDTLLRINTTVVIERDGALPVKTETTDFCLYR